MRSETVFKQTFNRALDSLSSAELKSAVASENILKQSLKASRTTVRKVLDEMQKRKIVAGVSGDRFVVRKPKKSDYFPDIETVATSAQVESKFMDWILRGDRKGGDVVNGLELARQFGVSTNAIREYLNRFSRFGLIERRPNSSWIIRGFTKEFALELFEVRELFETRSAMAFATQSENSPVWKTLRKLESEHRVLLRNISSRYHDFSGLDERFHRLINNASNNRFIVDFYDIISLIFHYHYQWNKVDEKQRNRAAILEHLEYIEALLSRDPKRIELACKSHLNSARKTLLASIRHTASDAGKP
ncbi:GntR family transcriptional regulator [Aestuariivirga litoralis]|uniref:GntR family transcriptional regulator n=1 Tax=Aestuariivirga litoralis TaxID=2650924 RepID=UPI0018C6375E|nr:GntR family transcriptional regulator [Aestuariivirga litoralis]MBG1230755.1 GntR family transcriptional regulator [Aestuariivirga litoralis]